MQKINSLKLLNISVEGFKCFREKSFFDFGDMTFIKGANHLGKSSIADAIAFAFVGTSFFGEKGLDKLHNPDVSEMKVSVGFVDENGEIHKLTRVHKGNATNISLDNINVRQTAINEVFGDKDLFLSLFNPLYFIETIGPEGKALLERLLPVVKHSDILEALPEPVKDDMQDESIISPEAYIKNKRAEIREYEENLIYYQGRVDASISTDKDAEYLSQCLYEESLAIIERIKSFMAEPNMDSQSPNKAKELPMFLQNEDTLSTAETIEAAIAYFANAIELKHTEIAETKAKAYESGCSEAISQQESSLALLYQEFDSLDGTIKKLEPGYQCPSCFTVITADRLPEVKGNLEYRLKQCVSAGSKAKKELKSLKDLDAVALRVFDVAKNEKVNMLEAQLSKLIALHSELTSHNLEALKLEALASANKPNGVDYSSLIKETEQRINRLNSKISSAAMYIAKKNELLFSSLNMNRVGIQLNEVVKATGEIKDIYRFTYEGREYKRLSLSEKILAGLEVTELIKRLSDRDYPTFIDNSESICTIDNVRPSSQLIFSIVAKGKPLSVTYSETALRKAG
jgi:hypothetical protein